jgi:hypothetical protein
MPNGIQPPDRHRTVPAGVYPGSPRSAIVAPAGFYAVDSDDITRKPPKNTDVSFTLVSTRRLMNADASLILPTPEPGRF